MGLFETLGYIAGEVIMSPLTVTKGVIDGVEAAIDRITD